MNGKFNYPELRARLDRIRDALNKETDAWALEGMDAVKREIGIAANLQRQYEQVVEAYKGTDSVNVDMELVDGNPFVWQIVLFGRPMTNLDGGIFRLRLFLSRRFPDEQPRVRFETKIFHQRVSEDGVLCYFPQRPDDLKSHVDAMIAAVEDESPAYDPRTIVNPEAAKLFWGNADEKKSYSRQLRRSVQRSSEME